MKKVETRKIIALTVTLAYILMNSYTIVVGKSMPDAYVAVTSSIIGYYFGKSTALEGGN